MTLPRRKSKLERLQRRVRTGTSGTIPLTSGDPLFGFDPDQLPSDAYRTERVRALVVALGQRGFEAGCEHRFGVLPGNRWALLAVRDLRYLYAWEIGNHIEPDPSLRPRSLKFLGPPPPFTKDELFGFLVDVLKDVPREEVSAWVAQSRHEARRRAEELDQDIRRASVHEPKDFL